MSSSLAVTREQIQRELQYRLCESHGPGAGLAAFLRLVWPILEPQTPLDWNWHLDAMAEHLEAVTRGEIKHLIINVPPGFGKSILVTCAWPCFEWGPAHMAHTRWLFTSYAQILSIRDSLRRRLILASKLYKDGWGHEFTVGGRKYLADGAEQYTNTKMGFHLATSVGGSNTGQRGDRVVYDDPHNMNEIHSEIRRTGVLQWDDQVMSTRINDIRTSARVLVMQRGHEADLSGHLLKQGGWTHLCLPFEFRKKSACVTPYFRDPRTEEDEPIFPLRWPAEEVERQKKKLGSYAWSGQYQQDPSPEEGGILKVKWFRWFAPQGHEYLNGQFKDALGRDILPLPFSFDQKIDSWDFSFGSRSDTASYCVGQAWGRKKSIAYLRRQAREKWSFPEMVSGVKDLQRWSRAESIRVETKANGAAILDTLTIDIPGLLGAEVELDKVSRAHAASPRLEAGNFAVPHPNLGGEYAFVGDFFHELKMFPNGQNDDQVDAMTMADRFLWLQSEFDEDRFDNRDRGL